MKVLNLAIPDKPIRISGRLKNDLFIKEKIRVLNFPTHGIENKHFSDSIFFIYKDITIGPGYDKDINRSFEFDFDIILVTLDQANIIQIFADTSVLDKLFIPVVCNESDKLYTGCLKINSLKKYTRPFEPSYYLNNNKASFINKLYSVEYWKKNKLISEYENECLEELIYKIYCRGIK